MRIKVIFTVFLLGMILMHPVRSFAGAPFDSASLLKVYEDSMKSIQYVRINARTDKEKEAANARLLNLMSKALLLPRSFDYPFDSLVTIGRLPSPDNQFRIITWDVPKSGGVNAYYGFIQSYNARKKKYDLFILKDHTADIPNLQTATCTPDKWIGTLYFKIVQEKGSKSYTLLGLQCTNKLINRKIIDVLTFNAQGVPSFGKSIFEKLPSTFKANPKRMIFEYSAQVYMSLRYNETKNMVLFDKLGPIEDGLEGQHQYYGPSFQIDGLSYKNGVWSYVVNVEARNPNRKEDAMFNDPRHPTYQQNNTPVYSPH